MTEQQQKQRLNRMGKEKFIVQCQGNMLLPDKKSRIFKKVCHCECTATELHEAFSSPFGHLHESFL